MSWQNKLYRSKKKEKKYGNEEVDSLCSYGFSHRSKLERSVCELIRLRELAGDLEHLAHEETVYLSRARYRYVADFKCRDKAGVLFIEAKGFADKRWPTTKKLWKAYGPGRLEIWIGNHRRPVLEKTIVPDPGEEECQK